MNPTIQFPNAENVSVDMIAKDEYTTRSQGWNKRRKSAFQNKGFVFWDGEGITHNPDEKQSYVLFGSSRTEPIIAKSLGTKECLEALLEGKRLFPNDNHVAFAFDYDVNMMLRDLRPHQIERLAKFGAVRWGAYRIEHLPHKWLKVSKTVDGETESIKVSDLFGFFQCSFVKALESYIPNHPAMMRLDQLKDGKDSRNTFKYSEIDTVEAYWRLEGELGEALADQLRDHLQEVDLHIGQWHGPGAIANYVYKANNIQGHKHETTPEVRNAARYAYAGGRFELFRMGRHVGPVYGLDINSAYPDAISRLPSLSEGVWVHNTNPTTIQEFGVYRIKMKHAELLRPAPVFHRDPRHNISFPWYVEGWYWSPEVIGLVRSGLAEVVEGYEYLDWSSRPFGFVSDMFARRRELKAAKIGAEKAIKLALNSLYGKMAQRVGWEHKGQAPTWHQLSWAGYVTSATRAKLYTLLSRIPQEHLIGVETDGIYTTLSPDALNVSHSTELGQWEITELDEIMYAQSGVYFYKKGGEWTGKYRGLDKGSLTSDSIAQYLQSLKANSDWEPISGPTTRFIGYKAALMRATKDECSLRHHRRWETTTKDIHVGAVGKRVHLPQYCAACKLGATAYDMPHDLTINSLSALEPMSSKHEIPWEDNMQSAAPAQWRFAEEEDRGFVYA